MITLIVCEKPAVSAAVCAALNVKERRNGYFYGGGYAVTWCYGHLVKLADAEIYDVRYKKWELEDLPIIPRKYEYIPVKNSRTDSEKQLQVISDLMKNPEIDNIICAADAGRESELIFRLVYDFCKCQKPVKRLWINSLEETAVLRGMKNLRDSSEYDNLYKSALCRQTADWLIGCSFTRVFSLIYGSGVTLNIGRVQSPTLSLIAERQKRIDKFIKEPFYTVEIDCGEFSAVSEKIKYKSAAENIREICGGNRFR
jgi:DNA topoisomerase-3